jgi:glucose/arabinose dehydrogenase
VWALVGRDGAMVAVHGRGIGRRRVPRRAVDAVASRGRTLGPARTLVGGFQPSDGSRWGRSVDAVPGHDGAIYVSDDAAGAI